MENIKQLLINFMPNARLRGWQRIPLNSNTTTATTAAHWDWKRRALTVPLRRLLNCIFKTIMTQLKTT